MYGRRRLRNEDNSDVMDLASQQVKSNSSTMSLVASQHQQSCTLDMESAVDSHSSVQHESYTSHAELDSYSEGVQSVA